MLHFFARRVREIHEKDEQGQKGFTLIELLVVIIIIGILAAIAIPTFLAQRTRGFEATARSDVRNAATAATSCFADVQPSTYASCDTTAELRPYGFNPSADVTIAYDSNATDWSAVAQHNNSGSAYVFSTLAVAGPPAVAAGQVEEEARGTGAPAIP